jgi:hypothetical protein
MRREVVRCGGGDYPEHSVIIDYERRGTSRRYTWYGLPGAVTRSFSQAATFPLTFRTRFAGRGVFLKPALLHSSSRSGLRGKDRGLETEGFEPFELDGIQWLVEPPLSADSDHGGVFKLTGDHQGRGAGRRFVVPTG